MVSDKIDINIGSRPAGQMDGWTAGWLAIFCIDHAPEPSLAILIIMLLEPYNR